MMKPLSQHHADTTRRVYAGNYRAMFGSKCARLPVVCLVALLLVGCNQVDRMKWREEVYLHDGTTVVLEREATRYSDGFPVSHRGAVLTEEIRYPPLGIYWNNGVRDEPLAFDIFDGIAFLVTSSPEPLDKFCKDKSPGALAASFYRWQAGEWKKVGEEDVPATKMRANLSGFSHWGITSATDKTYMSWHDVNRANANSPDLPPVGLVKLAQATPFLSCPKSNAN